MTADIPPVAPRSSGSKSAGSRLRTAPRKGAGKGDPATMSPADLVAGPCALPDAPLPMPHQVIERDHGLLRRLMAGFGPHNPAAPSAGTGQ